MTVSLPLHLLVGFLSFINNDLHDLTFNIFSDFLLWITPTNTGDLLHQECKHATLSAA